ncbi:MAG: GTPase Era [Eubacteriales bacterium]|nr:GTPase Era [Eubacteriales bacterium]
MKSGFVALIGRPNAGKSTLMNEILGKKVAIMSDKPQTTRNRITGIYTKEDVQIVFLDTPGIHKPKHRLGEYMVDVAEKTMRDVDILFYMVDASVDFKTGEEFIVERLKSTNLPIFLILNKIDLISKEDLLRKIDFWQRKLNFAEIFPVSALKRDNVDQLIERTKKYLEEGPMFYPSDEVTDQPEKVVISEIIREKILKRTKEEIPHSVAVVIEQIEEKKKGEVINILASIYVERSSQKKIVIGKQGQLLKMIGQDARRELENILGARIFLDLWVKVKEDWRNKNTTLSNFGYNNKDF